ncbi:MAG: acetolactate synthase small subunit [Victivallaceae bacterium]|mgnify:CR=1 FL=1|nr:acetolactate synthase small subunit [Victivallaceae bacterium]MDD3704282.1 acetolactate synthase small subunit [Victivallaceae bacterium]MDD4318481.1 acetolactate synthase small subunit [Victivallaceae bacterium]MDD5663355.1 acetolactate synthase small subunit [Victivallaceae bacterium]NLK82552.1 acetolactate synthase small subunit [Lentisphaerota bacterium]
MRKHTISVLVENKFGVLARVAGLFSGRGYNICSLTVNQTHNPKFSQMTIVTSGDEAVLEQINKQLNKLVDVISVNDLTGSDFIESEMVLLKIKATDFEQRSKIIQLVEIFKGKIALVNSEEIGIEIHGHAEKIDNFIDLLSEFEILETARSGRVAISRNIGSIQIQERK